MNRFTSASLQSGILRYKNLTVGDVRPDATTKLYKRMFKGTSRKYIPVKDVTSDTMGRELNAYLINPEYIDKSVIDPDTVSRQLTPAPVIKAVQYSRLTYTRPRNSFSKRTIHRTAALFAAAASIGQKAIASAKKVASQVKHTTLRAPLSRTYSLRNGMALHKRQKILAKAGGLVAIASFGIIGLQGIDFQQPVSQPAPVVTTSNSVVENPITSLSTAPSQPIPIYNDPSSPTSAQTNGYTVQPRASYQSSNTGQQRQQLPVAMPVQAAQPVTVNPVITPTAPVETPSPSGGGIIVEEEPVVNTPPVITPAPTVTDPITTPVVETVVDTTTQTLDGVTNLVGGVLGQ